MNLQDSGLEGWVGLKLLPLPGLKLHLRVWGLERASWVPRGVPGWRKSPMHGSPSSALSPPPPTSASFPAAPGRKLSLVFVGISSPKGWGGGRGKTEKANHRVDHQGKAMEELTSLRKAGRGRLVLQLRGSSRSGFLGLRQDRRLPLRGHGAREVARRQRPEPRCSQQEETRRN